MICREQLYRRVKGRKWKVIGLLLVWVLPVLAISPQLVITGMAMRVKRNDSGTITGLAWVCVETFSKQDNNRHVYTFTIAACFYLLPLSVMGFCYGAIVRKVWSRRNIPQVVTAGRLNPQTGVARRKRVTAMLVTLVMAFTLLWLPFFSASLYVEFGGNSYKPSVRAARAFLQLTGYCTCCVNPIIYSFFSRRFQDHLCDLFCRSLSSRVHPIGNPPELQMTPAHNEGGRENLANLPTSVSRDEETEVQTITQGNNN